MADICRHIHLYLSDSHPPFFLPSLRCNFIWIDTLLDELYISCRQWYLILFNEPFHHADAHGLMFEVFVVPMRELFEHVAERSVAEVVTQAGDLDEEDVVRGDVQLGLDGLQMVKHRRAEV